MRTNMNFYAIKKSEGIHTVRVTFMYEDYFGHIAYEINGNCKGRYVLDFDILASDANMDIERYVENDCDFTYDSEKGVFRCKLHKAAGKTYDYEAYADDFANIIVGMQIIDFREE